MNILFGFLSLFFPSMGQPLTAFHHLVAPTTSSYLFFHFPDTMAGDTIWSSYRSTIIDPTHPETNVLGHQQDVFAVLDKVGNAVIKVEPVPTYGYISISLETDQWGHHRPLLDNFLLKQGDSIRIEAQIDSLSSPTKAQKQSRPYQLSFSGIGGKRFEWYYLWQNKRTDRTIFSYPLDYIPAFNEKTGMYNEDNYYYTTNRMYLNVLSRYKPYMEPEEYEICQADVVGNSMAGFFESNRRSITVPQQKIDSSLEIMLYPANISDHHGQLSEVSRFVSKNYCYGLFMANVSFYRKEKLGQMDDGFYSRLKKRFSGRIRDKLICQFFFSTYISQVQDMDSIIRDASAIVRDGDIRAKIIEVGRKSVGAYLFSFRLSDQNGHLYKPTNFKNKVIFADFYYKGCGHCTDYYKTAVQFAEEKYQGDTNVVFLPICIDAKREVWLSAIKSGLYTRQDKDNLINLYTSGLGAEHPLIKYYNIVGYPCPLIVDKRGRIFRFNDPSLRNRESLQKLIAQALTQY